MPVILNALVKIFFIIYFTKKKILTKKFKEGSKRHFLLILINITKIHNKYMSSY